MLKYYLREFKRELSQGLIMELLSGVIEGTSTQQNIQSMILKYLWEFKRELSQGLIMELLSGVIEGTSTQQNIQSMILKLFKLLNKGVLVGTD